MRLPHFIWEFLRLYLPLCNKGVRIQSQKGLNEDSQPRSACGFSVGVWELGVYGDWESRGVREVRTQ